MRKAPRRCTDITESQSFSVILNSRLSRRIPALLTRTVGAPSSSTTRATAAAAASVSPTSAPRASASPPAARMASTVASQSCSRRSSTATRNPSAASRARSRRRCRGPRRSRGRFWARSRESPFVGGHRRRALQATVRVRVGARQATSYRPRGMSRGPPYTAREERLPADVLRFARVPGHPQRRVDQLDPVEARRPRRARTTRRCRWCRRPRRAALRRRRARGRRSAARAAAPSVGSMRSAAGMTSESMPSSSSRTAWYPVSSSTSRTAASAGSSPGSMPPPGRVHPDLPALRPSAGAGRDRPRR